MGDKKFSAVDVSRYDKAAHFTVCRPASLNSPADHAGRFVMGRCLANIGILKNMWEPRMEFCRFFKENGIRAIK